MSDIILTLFSRLVGDAHPGTRVELCNSCLAILSHRFKFLNHPSYYAAAAAAVSAVYAEQDVDIQLVVYLLILQGDESGEVSKKAAEVSISSGVYMHMANFL